MCFEVPCKNVFSCKAITPAGLCPIAVWERAEKERPRAGLVRVLGRDVAFQASVEGKGLCTGAYCAFVGLFVASLVPTVITISTN
jgi:hypothetical protein